MILSVDAGNSEIVFALFKGGEVLGSFRLAAAPSRTSDEFGFAFINFFKTLDMEPSDIEGAVIASVVPNVMHSLVNSIRKYTNKEPVIVGPGIKTGIRLATENPKEIGADLISNAVGAAKLYGGPAIVIDFGTATTYELVLEDGTFRTVLICPGVKISAEALFQGTAKLPEFEIKKPGTAIPKDTVSALQAGLYFSTVGEAKFIVDAIKKESGLSDVKVIATGGFASVFSGEKELIDVTDTMLTLKGAYLIYELNK